MALSFNFIWILPHGNNTWRNDYVYS